MKQKALYISAVAVMALSSMACSDDFFETSSKTTMNSETAYSNVETAEMALVGCYDGWQRTISDEGMGIYMMSEFASDECFSGAGVGDPRNYSIVDKFTMDPAPSEVNLFQTDWQNYYKAIYRCNMLIVNDVNVNWESDSVARGRIIGECRGIRGLLYFDLARMFGDVPLLTEPTDANVPRTDVKEVYQVIFDDLKFAAANIPAEAYNAGNLDNTDGRMSKYAAEALLARAYLFYTGYYGVEHPACTKTEATDAINDVVENGGYDLETNFADLWMPACTEDASTGDTYAWKTTYAGKHYNNGKWNAGQTGLSKEFVLNLKMNTTHDYNGNSDGLTFQVFLGSRNVSKPPYATGWGICVPNSKFVQKYASDPRMAHSVVDYAGIGFESQGDFSKCLNDSYEYTGYGIKKYAPLCFADGTRESVGFKLGAMHTNITYYIDYTVVRYADVLLMHSELNGTAMGLNKVQERAGVTQTAWSLDAVREERAKELAFEGIRYWDLLRYGQTEAATVLADMQNGVTVLNGGIESTVSFDATNFTTTKGLMQIPNAEISLSGNTLTQNMGW